jgi:hypothetical protein
MPAQDPTLIKLLLGTAASGLAHRYLSNYLGGEQSQGKKKYGGEEILAVRNIHSIDLYRPLNSLTNPKYKLFHFLKTNSFAKRTRR